MLLRMNGRRYATTHEQRSRLQVTVVPPAKPKIRTDLLLTQTNLDRVVDIAITRLSNPSLALFRVSTENANAQNPLVNQIEKVVEKRVI